MSAYYLIAATAPVGDRVLRVTTFDDPGSRMLEAPAARPLMLQQIVSGDIYVWRLTTRWRTHCRATCRLPVELLGNIQSSTCRITAAINIKYRKQHLTFFRCYVVKCNRINLWRVSEVKTSYSKFMFSCNLCTEPVGKGSSLLARPRLRSDSLPLHPRHLAARNTDNKHPQYNSQLMQKGLLLITCLLFIHINEWERHST